MEYQLGFTLRGGVGGGGRGFGGGGIGGGGGGGAGIYPHTPVRNASVINISHIHRTTTTRRPLSLHLLQSASPSTLLRTADNRHIAVVLWAAVYNGGGGVKGGTAERDQKPFYIL